MNERQSFGSHPDLLNVRNVGGCSPDPTSNPKQRMSSNPSRSDHPPRTSATDSSCRQSAPRRTVPRRL